MTNANDVRRAHDLLDGIINGHILGSKDVDHLRSFLPELPKQKTLEDVQREVYERWLDVEGDEWDSDNWGTLEEFLGGLQYCLKDLIDAEPAKPVHPEFLETEADYRDAPEGTIVVAAKASPLMKGGRWWEAAPYKDRDSKEMAGESRRILRWGWGNE